MTYSFLAVNFVLILLDYALTVALVGRSTVFSELMPAFFTNINCPGLLDNTVFELIGAKNCADEVYIKEIAKTANEQFTAGLITSSAYNFISNQFLLVCRLLRYCSIVNLLVLQVRIQLLPAVAPFLDALGLFDNTPRPEYLGFSYSEFMVRGMLNTYKVLKTGSITGIPDDSIRHAAAFLDALIIALK